MAAKIKFNLNALKFLQGLKTLQIKYPETAKNIALEFGNEAVKKGRQGIIPRQTHNLASTARVEIEENAVLFITGGIQGAGTPPKFVDYALFVEMGTSKQPPQFFMERSINAAALEFNSISQKALLSWLNNFSD